MGFYIVCPFYKSDSRLSVTCEDCVRQFFSKDEKTDYIKKYCESIEGYRRCRYAAELLKFYEECEGMSKEEREIKRLKHIAAAKHQENEKLRLKFGHMNAKIKSLEMLCGYLAELSSVFEGKNEAEISVKKMCEFFGKYEVDWKSTDGEFIVVTKKRKAPGKSKDMSVEQ